MNLAKIIRNLGASAFLASAMGSGVQAIGDCSVAEDRCLYYFGVCTTWFPEQCEVLGQYANEEEVVEYIDGAIPDQCDAFINTCYQALSDCWVCDVQH
jgi:hypothetical protein